MAMKFAIGDTWQKSRTFDRETIDAFTRVTGDDGAHHVVPDEDGRVMAQGLLTASLVTSIGGDLNFIVRKTCFDFKKPVYSGDTIICTARVDELEERENRWRMNIVFEFVNQNDELVMEGFSRGVVLK